MWEGADPVRGWALERGVLPGSERVKLAVVLEPVSSRPAIRIERRMEIDRVSARPPAPKLFIPKFRFTEIAVNKRIVFGQLVL